MGREICQGCHYATRLCVCDLVPKLPQPLDIVIYQHPKEVKHAKNTVKLLKLVWPAIKVVVLSEDDKATKPDFSDLEDGYVLLYLGQESQGLSSATNAQKHAIKGLVLIDGTWRKAYKLLSLYPQLQGLPRVCLENVPRSLYDIRKAPHESALSSLEALAYACDQINGDFTVASHAFTSQPLLTFMAQAQRRLWQHRPNLD